MHEWHRQIQRVVDRIDSSIRARDDAALTLGALARELGYSQFHTTRQFRALSGMPLRQYLGQRRLAFALIDVRDSQRCLLDIALDHGFSSHEAFTRAFRERYGITPSAYRKNPVPVVLRTKVSTFDRYILGIGEIGMVKSNREIKVYYVSIPAHKFLHIKRYDSEGYFDFWEKQAQIPGQDCDSVCGLLDSIKGKLDGDDSAIGEFSGQVMAHLFEADGRTAEAYGVRLPASYKGAAPDGMLLMDVPGAEYIVFEHGAFDFESECGDVGEQLQTAIDGYRFQGSGYCLDETPGRVAYFYMDPARFEKRIRPVKKG